jgi:hypothetical protein
MKSKHATNGICTGGDDRQSIHDCFKESETKRLQCRRQDVLIYSLNVFCGVSCLVMHRDIVDLNFGRMQILGSKVPLLRGIICRVHLKPCKINSVSPLQFYIPAQRLVNFVSTAAEANTFGLVTALLSTSTNFRPCRLPKPYSSNRITDWTHSSNDNRLSILFRTTDSLLPHSLLFLGAKQSKGYAGRPCEDSDACIRT